MSIFLNRTELLEGEDSGRALVLDILEAGIVSVFPKNAMKGFFGDKGELLPLTATVLGWGKASLDMFVSFMGLYFGDISGGHIITLPQQKKATKVFNVEISVGAHPLPDKTSVESSEKLLAFAEELNEKDTLICLISGGGSAMFEVPRDGINLENLRNTYKMLIESGADIHEVNSVRRALSKNKGGGLARVAYPAKVINIVISDVPGNNLEDIASGPTVADPFKIKPMDVVKKYSLEGRLDNKILEEVHNYKPIEIKYFRNVVTHIIADNNKAVEAMKEKAASLGYDPVRFPGYLYGEARNVVTDFMETEGELVIGGGETTVTVKGDGRGGRNQEFVLAGLKKLKGGILASLGTDGIDGNTDAAGAIGDEKVLERASEKGLKIDTFLEKNNSYEFFEECGGLINTGNTGTNVADICVLLREGANES